MNPPATDSIRLQSAGATDAVAGGDALRARLRVLARNIRQAYLQVFGIPDYERYVAHRTAHHPGEPLLSRQKFSAQAIDRKYRGNGPRCC
jgi:uncharacterized short protein YbdD (DUF466 family)